MPSVFLQIVTQSFWECCASRFLLGLRVQEVLEVLADLMVHLGLVVLCLLAALFCQVDLVDLSVLKDLVQMVCQFLVNSSSFWES
jgi:hypothetical protein